MTNTGDEFKEPPSKRIKSEEFVTLIDDCYELQFSIEESRRTEDQKERLRDGIKQIRCTIEQVMSSNDISLGATRSANKINWGKCVSLLLENGPENIKALSVMTGRLTPGGGLL